MNKILIILIILQLLVSILIAEDKGKLEEFEEELNKPVEHNNNENNNSDYGDEDEEDVFDNLILCIAHEIFIGSEPSLYIYKFQPYIYYDSYSGRYGDEGVSLDTDIDFKYIYSSSNLTGISFNGSFFFAHVMNLKCNYQKLNEELENSSDEMEIYEIFMDYYRVRLPGFNWYWGIGAKGLNRNNNYWGFALNTGFEIYPFKPVSIDLAANIGWLNEHPVSKINTDFNIHYWRIKFTTGYQRLKTGYTEINSFNFGLGFNF